jgi:ornithine--oxo-acid transaminase
VAIASLQVLKDEDLARNAAEMGELFRKLLHELGHENIREVRGKGLMNAIEIEHPDKDAAWHLCMELKENGLLAKPTHGDKIRFAPPLVINEEQIRESVDIIRESLSVIS